MTLDTGLLFCQARRTFLLQQEVERLLRSLDCGLGRTAAAFSEEELFPALSALLGQCGTVFVVSPEEACGPWLRPAAAAPLFRRLRIAVGEDGEPKDILRLYGEKAEGYLIESRTQAICLLPDLPQELPALLDTLEERLNEPCWTGPPSRCARNSASPAASRSRPPAWTSTRSCPPGADPFPRRPGGFC